MDIEKEVEARVEFKINEILTNVKNRAKHNWSIAFDTTSIKHQYYWEAFNQLANIIEKEIEQPTPYDEMSMVKFYNKRDSSVEKIMNRMTKRGTRDYHQKERFIVEVVEELLNYK